MSLFYKFLYQVGFTPWEAGLAQHGVVAQISAMFEREEAGRVPPYGRALDLGCGSGIHAVELARRGWQVTGIDIVHKAIDRARYRANQFGEKVNFIHGDVTCLRDRGVGNNFNLILDFGTVHGLSWEQCQQVGEEVSAVASGDASILMLAFEPGRRGPLPRGLSKQDIQAIFPEWRIVEEMEQDAELPPFLKRTRANPRWYRLRRQK